MEYEIVMGLEVHVELSTESKLFCSCSAKFGAAQNEHVCPACCGMPGMPAVLNKKAVELGIIAGLLTNSEIAPKITFDKKNYFYPDLPTGYQITQLFAPICKNGHIEIDTSKGLKTITLKQIHIEEDAGKLVHDNRSGTTLIDYNRAGVPLIEIVSNPDFRNSEQVIAYLTKLQKLLSFAKVSDCKMQEGSMRCDVNISVRKKGEKKYGVRTEIKNMNSYKAIERAIAFESARHIEILTSKKEELTQETRGFDDNNGETYPMRSKEDAHDYRYFPNPEIPPVEISDKWISEVASKISETFEAKYTRYLNEFGLTKQDCEILIANIGAVKIFEDLISFSIAPKDAANWIITDLLGLLKTEKKDIESVELDCKKFGKIIELVKQNKINRDIGKAVLQLLIKDNALDIEKHLTANNLYISSNTEELQDIIQTIIKENPKPAEEFRAGNEKVLTFFMGRIMKATKGKADPKIVGEMLNKILAD
ncbi:MAG: Asp-tRNA(Asn)/Glu-tRNA(Gln) amidotransferase subunit GatB [Firmicutes bacterium]|nr:Asp-tRNA(Asn)/Glu-tRNA(Gln) amidotransferase subunit GatB [Bacillota bacterium]